VGKGIDLAREFSPEHAAVLDDFKDQLLVVLMKRLAEKGKLTIPIAEVDDTGSDLLSFSVREGAFHFELGKKS
jgi:hypothetical protein